MVHGVMCPVWGGRGRLCCSGGEEGSVWWRMIQSVRDGVGQVDSGWLLDNITSQVGDGKSTLFWTNPWLDGEPLCKVYVRLFEFSKNKLESVANMMARGWSTDGEALKVALEAFCLGGRVVRGEYS
jgi:hypothetical protein